jgi:hypothetical protein
MTWDQSSVRTAWRCAVVAISLNLGAAVAPSFGQICTQAFVPEAPKRYPMFGWQTSMSQDGRVLAIYAWCETPSQYEGRGAVYMYRRDEAGAWQPEGKLIPLGVGHGGVTVMPVVVGANGEAVYLMTWHRDGDGAGMRTIRTFSPDNGAWREADVDFIESSPGSGCSHETPFDVSDDASVIVVGHDGHHPGAEATGPVDVYHLDGESWRLARTLMQPDPAGRSEFGRAVDVSADGQRIIVGAYYDRDMRGAAYIYRRELDDWVLEATLRPREDDHGGEFENELRFGDCVRLDDVGDTAFVGAPSFDRRNGAVIQYERQGAGWVRTQTIAPMLGGDGPNFGDCIEVSRDGMTMLAGMQMYDTHLRATGAAAVLHKIDREWVPVTVILEPQEYATPFDCFGVAVAMASDGSHCVVTAPFASAYSMVWPGPGAAYAYDLGTVMQCLGDLDGDDDVDIDDLGKLCRSFEIDDGGDTDRDGDTDLTDLGNLLSHYGLEWE